MYRPRHARFLAPSPGTYRDAVFDLVGGVDDDVLARLEAGKDLRPEARLLPDRDVAPTGRPALDDEHRPAVVRAEERTRRYQKHDLPLPDNEPRQHAVAGTERPHERRRQPQDHGHASFL